MKSVHWRLPSPSGNVVSPEIGAFVDHGNGKFEEIPGPAIREGMGQNRVQIKDVGPFLYSSEYSHQFQQEATDSFVRRCHFALTDAFIWLSGYLYRHREDSGSPLADRKLSDACSAFRGYLGSQKDFAPESLIVEIARNAPGAISSIVAGPRMVLMREHTEVPLDKIQEMDVFSLVDLARRPGRTVAMKAGPKQRLTALTRRETADTVENRVVLDFILRSARSARQYVDEMCARCPRRAGCQLHDPVVEKDCPSERVKIVATYSRHCAAWTRGGAFAEVTRLKEPRTRPNYVLQQNIRYVKVWKYYLKLLRLEDVEEDIVDASDENLLEITKHVSAAIPSAADATSEECRRLAESLDVAEINVIDANGFIVASTAPEFIGFDMASGEQSSEFLVLLPGSGQQEFVQAYRPISYDASTSRKYAGVSIEGGFVQVGYDAQNFVSDLSAQVESSVKNRHVGQRGELVVIDHEEVVEVAAHFLGGLHA